MTGIPNTWSRMANFGYISPRYFSGTTLELLLLLHTVLADDPHCWIRCGVVKETRDDARLPQFVKSVWVDLKQQRSLSHVDIMFEEIEPRWQQTMTELLDAYVNIGSSNASVVIGPYMQPIAKATERHNIPYFVTSDVRAGQYQPYNIITIFPSLANIYGIALDIVRRYEWKHIAVLYDDFEGLCFLEKLLQNPNIHVRTLKMDSTTNMARIRTFLLEVRQQAVYDIVVLTSPAATEEILQAGLRFSMMSSQHSWLIPSLSLHESTLMTYAYTLTNLTTFHLVQRPITSRSLVGGQQSAAHYATVHDSLLTLYDAVAIHQRNRGDCYWTNRDNIHGTLSKITDQGITGMLSFTSDGTRQGYQVDIMGLKETGLMQIGLWNSSVRNHTSRLNMFAPIETFNVDAPKLPLGPNIVPVVTIIEDPFVRYSDLEDSTGNDRFEGFCVDLLDKIAESLGFQYQLYLVPDGQYGEKQPDGSWNGLIGELANGNASLAVAALSITSSRESVIDFTKPYKADGISIVMRRPTQKSSFFQFTEPLSGIVWLLMLAVILFTSISLYVLDKTAPLPEEGARFSVQESFWFTFASMVLSGTDIHPRTVPGRILAGALWLFSLIIISTYTANLAAFLTVTKFDNNINSLFDLVEQSKVKYGTVVNSDVGAFFQNNKIPRFEELWQMMSKVEPDSMANNSALGFSRARNDAADYAFIWDTPAVKYQVENDCNLLEIGEPMGSRVYGIGVPLGAQYRDDISMVILKMAETGEISALEHKWWTSPVKCPDVEQAKPSKTRSLTVDNVGGVFIILVIGILLAVVSAIFDYLLRTRTLTNRNNRRASEKSSDKNHYDCAIPNLQLEEPFLTYTTRADGSTRNVGKQTNIF